MKGWGHYETVQQKATRPEPEPDLYYEVARGMDTINKDGRVDIEVRRGSVTVRRISPGTISGGETIEAHEITEGKVCDAVKKAME